MSIYEDPDIFELAKASFEECPETSRRARRWRRCLRRQWRAGGWLGATTRASPKGVEASRNHMTGYVVVRAESAEAAAKLFESHPHFVMFPGEAVEIMERLPIPTN